VLSTAYLFVLANGVDAAAAQTIPVLISVFTVGSSDLPEIETTALGFSTAGVGTLLETGSWANDGTAPAVYLCWPCVGRADP